MLKILVYPTSENPYQNLLYNEYANRSDIKVKYLNGHKYKFHSYQLLLKVPFKIIWNRLQGYNIFHLHWVSFNFPSISYGAKLASFIYTFMNILLIKILGYKLFWTVHNIIPHNQYTINDLLITKLLFLISNFKIIHTESTLQEIKKYNLNKKNIVIIPHGNYSSYYTNSVSKKEARKHINIKTNEFVFLFFGMIKEYKGIEELLDCFNKLSRKVSNVTLVVSGKSYDINLTKIITEHKKSLKNKLKIFLEHIPDEHIQYYMNAADVVVYPFKKITTSGSLILALSFGRPIIFPRLGALKNIPDNVGFCYSNSNKKGLYQSMQNALKHKNELGMMGKNITLYIKSLSWETIAKKTLEVYKAK